MIIAAAIIHFRFRNGRSIPQNRPPSTSEVESCLATGAIIREIIQNTHGAIDNSESHNKCKSQYLPCRNSFQIFVISEISAKMFWINIIQKLQTYTCHFLSLFERQYVIITS